MATIEEQYAQRQADAQNTYNTRQAENTALYNQRQAEAQNQYNQRNAEAQNTYNQRLSESQGKINDLYGKALDAQKLQYQSALDKGIAAQEEARSGIAQSYQTSANDLAVQYERNRRNLNAQALAQGLNTGTGSQQQLALNQGYLSAYGRLRGEESAQNAGIDRAIANLKVDYQANISQAMADNDYKKAAALLDDYNDKLNWLDNQKMNNQNRYDTLSDTNRGNLDQYRMMNQSRYDEMTDNARDWADRQNDLAYDRAEMLASYGDFSGYEKLYGKATADSMKEFWVTQNPDAAYQMGLIDPNRYFSITGAWPAGYDPFAAALLGGGFGGGGGWGGGGGGDDDSTFGDPNTGGKKSDVAVKAGSMRAGKEFTGKGSGAGLTWSLDSNGIPTGKESGNF